MDPFEIEFQSRPSTKKSLGRKRVLPAALKLVRKYILTHGVEWVHRTGFQNLQVQSHEIGRALHELVHLGYLKAPSAVPTDEIIRYENVTLTWRKGFWIPVTEYWAPRVRVVKVTENYDEWDGKAYQVLRDSEVFIQAQNELGVNTLSLKFNQSGTTSGRPGKEIPVEFKVKPIHLCDICGGPVRKKGRHARFKRGHRKDTCNINIVESVMKS